MSDIAVALAPVTSLIGATTGVSPVTRGTAGGFDAALRGSLDTLPLPESGVARDADRTLLAEMLGTPALAALLPPAGMLPLPVQTGTSTGPLSLAGETAPSSSQVGMTATSGTGAEPGKGVPITGTSTAFEGTNLSKLADDEGLGVVRLSADGRRPDTGPGLASPAALNRDSSMRPSRDGESSPAAEHRPIGLTSPADSAIRGSDTMPSGTTGEAAPQPTGTADGVRPAPVREDVAPAGTDHEYNTVRGNGNAPGTTSASANTAQPGLAVAEAAGAPSNADQPATAPAPSRPRAARPNSVATAKTGDAETIASTGLAAVPEQRTASAPDGSTADRNSSRVDTFRATGRRATAAYARATTGTDVRPAEPPGTGTRVGSETFPIARTEAPVRPAPVWATDRTGAAGTPAGGVRTVDQVASALSLQVKDGRTEATIALRPAALGAIKVQISSGADGMVIRLSAERDAVGELLRSQMGELREALAGQQVAVAELHVLHNPPAVAPAPAGNPEQPAPHWLRRDDERAPDEQQPRREQSEDESEA